MTAGTSVAPCPVCGHCYVGQIDAGLRGGTSVNDTAEVFGLPREVVRRHRVEHLGLGRRGGQS